jgi:hypothetical protein
MAVKIFCNSCQKFIKDATPNEIAGLRGTEICTDCEDGFSIAMREVEKISKRGIVQIERKRDDIKVKLEEAMRNVIGGDDEANG